MSAAGAGRRYRATFAVVTTAGVAYSLMQSLVSPAIPQIQHALHASVSSASWLLTAYLLSASIATPMIGRLGDMYGKARLLLIILVVLCLATAVCALATSLPVMIFGRVAQGSAGGIFPLGFGIIRDEFPRDRVAGAVGFMSALLGAGGGAGVVLAGPVIANFDFHFLFWLSLAALVPTTIAVPLVVPESPIRVPGRVNVIGAALMSVGLAGMLLAVSKAPVWGWLSTRTVGLMLAAAVLLAAWCVQEVRSSHPLVDMGMMRIRGVWTTNLVAALLGFGMYSALILLPEYVETPTRIGYGFGSSVSGAGLFLLPMATGVLVAGWLAGWLEGLFGSKPPLLAGVLSTGASFAVLALARREAWEIYTASSLLGIGIGLAFAAMINLIIENVGPGETGVATGMNAVTRTVGGAFGGAAVASILASTTRAHGYPTSGGYSMAFGACSLALVVGVLCGLAVPQRRPPDAFGDHAAGDIP